MRRISLLLCLLLTACANPQPFVDTEVLSQSVEVKKAKDGIEETGQVAICFDPDENPMADVDRLAMLSCTRYGLEARLERVNNYQCRVNAPSRAVYSCVDPEMRFQDGSYVNPFNSAQVRAWENRSGKPAPKRGVLRDLTTLPPL